MPIVVAKSQGVDATAAAAAANIISRSPTSPPWSPSLKGGRLLLSDVIVSSFWLLVEVTSIPTVVAKSEGVDATAANVRQ